MKESETDMLFKVELIEPPFYCPHYGVIPEFDYTKPKKFLTMEWTFPPCYMN